MPAGNLTDEDLRTLLTLVPVSNLALRAKIEADLPAPPSTLLLRTVNEDTEVEVVATPGPVDFALCADEHGASPLYEPKGVKIGGKVEGKPGHEWIDAHVSGATEWWSKAHGRIKVVVGAPPVEPPVEPPKPSTFKYGSNMKGWPQSQELADARKITPADGEACVRLDRPSAQEVQAWLAAGIAVDYLESGSFGSTGSHFSPEARELRSLRLLGQMGDEELAERHRVGGYLSGGVQQINRPSYATAAGTLMTTGAGKGCIYFGNLNEWAGDWFWGSGALSAANGAAMVELALEVDRVFRAAGVTALQIVGADGGHAGDLTALHYMLDHAPDLAKKLPNLRLSLHPYIGSGSSPNEPLKHFGSVEEAHKLTGLMCVVDEWGGPTVHSTGDSPLYTEAQQANGHKLMLEKCRASGFVELYHPFGYRDGSNPPGYGLFHADDSAKPAVQALANA